MQWADDPVPFSADLHRDGVVGVVRFKGELDLANVDEARTALAAALEARVIAVVVDLRGLVFMSSAGLRCLVEAQTEAARMGIRLAILNGSGAPHRALTLSGLSEVLEMIDHIDQIRA